MIRQIKVFCSTRNMVLAIVLLGRRFLFFGLERLLKNRFKLKNGESDWFSEKIEHRDF